MEENNAGNDLANHSDKQHGSKQKVNKVSDLFVRKMLELVSFNIESIEPINDLYANIKVTRASLCDFVLHLKLYKMADNKELTLVTEQEIKIDRNNVEKCVECLLSTKIIRLTKDLILLKLTDVNKALLTLSDQNQEIINLLLNLDFEYVRTNFTSIKMDKNNLSKFFFFLDFKKENDLNVYCTSKESFEALIKAVDYEKLKTIINTKNLSYYEEIYAKIRTKSMKYRFNLYECISSDRLLEKQASLMLKRLTEGTFDIVFEKYLNIVLQDPIMAIDLIIDQVLIFDAMITIYKKFITCMHKFFAEIFFFRTIYRLVNLQEIITRYSYARGYINLVNFIDVFYAIDARPIELFLAKNIRENIYMHIPLIENLYKYNKLKNFNLAYLQNAHINVFRHGKEPIQLKIDIADRYVGICAQLGINRAIETEKIRFENIKYLLPSQIQTLKNETIFNQILDRFLNAKNMDFFTIKNIVLIINSNPTIYRPSLVDFLDKFGNCEREDIRVLSQCCKANLITRKNTQKNIERQKIEIKTVVSATTTQSQDPSSIDKKLNGCLVSHAEKSQKETNVTENRHYFHKEVTPSKKHHNLGISRKSKDANRLAKYAKLNEHLNKNHDNQKIDDYQDV